MLHSRFFRSCRKFFVNNNFMPDCSGEPRSPIVLCANTKRTNNAYTVIILFIKSNRYYNCFVRFIKFVFTYNLYRYLRASDERPYRFVQTVSMLRHEQEKSARRVRLFFNRIILHTKNRAIVMTARYAEILCVNFYRKNQID